MSSLSPPHTDRLLQISRGGKRGKVVDLPAHELPTLLAVLEHRYVFDEDQAQQAVRARTGFPLIQVDSLMKVDVILAQGAAFDTAMRRLYQILMITVHLLA